MGIKLTDFKVNGVDVSTYNGTIDWSKVIASGCKFASIRIGYGVVKDKSFVTNIEAAQKTSLNLFAYLYPDYYSNWFDKISPVYGLSDEEWGRKQADFIYQMVKGYPRIKSVLIDVENTTVKNFPKLSDATTKPHAIAVYRAIIKRLRELKVKTGIYASLGWLSWFPVEFRSLPLWVAFYPYRTGSVDADDVIYMCQKNGWEVKPIMWQYASDGDVDDNGTSDGITMGMQYPFLDLNGWIGTDQEYESMFGEQVVVETPDDDAITVKPLDYEAHRVTAYLLNYRDSANGKILGTFTKDTPVNIEKVVNGWAKLYGQPGWVSAKYLSKSA